MTKGGSGLYEKLEITHKNHAGNYADRYFVYGTAIHNSKQKIKGYDAGI